MIDNISKEKISEDSDSSDGEKKVKPLKKAGKHKESLSDNLAQSINNLNKKFEKLVEDIEDKKYRTANHTTGGFKSGSGKKKDLEGNSTRKGKDVLRGGLTTKDRVAERKEAYAERRNVSDDDSEF